MDLFISAAQSYMDDNFNTAVEHFTKYISQQPTSDAYLYRAAAYIQLGNYEEALKDLAEAENRSKASYEIAYKRGIAFFYSEKYQEAHNSFVNAALLASSPDQRSNLDRWMGKTKLECPTVTTTQQTAPSTQTKQQAPSTSTSTTTTPSVQTQTTSTPPISFTHQWFQNPNYIFITLSSKTNLENNKVKVNLEKRTVTIVSNENNQTLYQLHLCNAIEPKLSTFDFKGTNISFNLKKEIEGFNWVTLEKEGVKEAINDSKTFSQYPTSAKVKKNWDQVDKELDAETKDDPGSNEAMMNLFRTIYEKGDEKTKLAMKKSFQTSGGTVLSTNWDEVKEKDYEGRDRPEPPKGQEWAKKD